MRIDDVLRSDLDAASIPHLLALAGQVVTRRWDRLVGQQHGVSAAGVQVLLMLAKGGATHREVARRCWVRPATLTGIVDTLERDGLVARRRSGTDRREVRLDLTDEGQRITAKVGRAVAEWFRPTGTERDPIRAAVVRQFLTETIVTHLEAQGETK